MAQTLSTHDMESKRQFPALIGSDRVFTSKTPVLTSDNEPHKATNTLAQQTVAQKVYLFPSTAENSSIIITKYQIA